MFATQKSIWSRYHMLLVKMPSKRAFFANGKRPRPSPDGLSSALFHVQFFLNFLKEIHFASQNRKIAAHSKGGRGFTTKKIYFVLIYKR